MLRFIGFPKRRNGKNMGLEWNVVLNPTGLYECLIVHRKNAGFFQSGLSGWDVSYEI